MLTELQKLRWIYGFGLGFIAVLGLCLFLEFFWVWAIPAALVIIWMALFRLDWLLLLIVFATPLSLNLEKIAFGLGIILPTEPLMFGAMLIFLIRLWYDHKFDWKIISHPITVAILFNLGWILMTSITSEMPVVSFKFLLSRMWFVITGYFMATQLFLHRKNIRRFLWIYAVPLCIVVVFTVIRHATFGFEEKPAHWVMQPFFKDHTSYGALIAMYIPILVGFIAIKQYHINTRILAFFLLSILLVGVIYSYTRAAWVSLLGAFALFLLIRFRVKVWQVGALLVLAIGLFFSFQTEIFQKLEKNRQDSSSDLTEHVESISNVATDASNLERINRWNSALRMFEERPVFGWGPGTYSFLYAPFQHSSELTIISTNFGDGGNAHSEYFGPLAESGVLGLLTFLTVVVLVFYYGIALYFRGNLDPELKVILLVVVLGYSTYIAHGTLNNFLDLDKASVPFWGFAALIVAMDVYFRKEGKGEEIEGELKKSDS
ncbi:MAG: O-antigen ligase family protein [Salibacteraceae bacterium]